MAMRVEIEAAPSAVVGREVCAGLDVHRSTIVVCATSPAGGGRLKKVWNEFPTTAAGLLRLAEWLMELGVTHVAMEATGVYWMPVYAALEKAGGIDLTVVNPHHAKALRKRKTDMKDAEWLAYLVRHDLANKSFVPAKPFRDLRDLTRYRRTLVEAAFPTVKHFAAWMGVCPGNNESAGKRKPIGARRGNPYLVTALCNAAISAARTRGSFFKATYHRLKSRRGGGRAALAVAHKIAIAIYYMITRQTPFRELGEDHNRARHTERTAKRCVRRLERLGFTVTIQPRTNVPTEQAQCLENPT